MALYRYICSGSGGLVIADTVADATLKLEKKYGTDIAEIWSWEQDDYYDDENQDVLDIYGS